jgi:hypothetical protein
MRRTLLAAILLIFATTAAFARSDDDRVSIGSNITVAEGENAGDIVCILCSVHVGGDVKGDVVVILGSLTVDANRSISRDTVVLGGDLNMKEDSTIGGDLSVVAGDSSLSTNATVHGSRTVLPGRFWLLVPFAPLLVLIGIIWLIVYLVRRNRYQFPVYPNGRGV